jgi:hypothetical protein
MNMAWGAGAIFALAGSLCADVTDLPLRSGAPGAAWLTLDWDQQAYEALREQANFTALLPLAPGSSAVLELQRFEVLAPDARLVRASPAGNIQSQPPDVLLLSGTVAGELDSRVFLALSPRGSNGYVRIAGQQWVIATRPAAEATPTIVYDTALAAVPLRALDCGNRMLPMGGQLFQPPGGGAGGIDNPQCRTVRIAIDTDWEYASQVFAGDWTAAELYAVTLIGAASDLLRQQTGVNLEISYLRIWMHSGDPYTAGTVDGRLHQFRDHWNTQMTSVDRHLAHMLSGLRWGSGGVAWVGAVCDASYGYGISGYLSGSFPTPLLHNHAQNWDPMIVAHELGHSLGAVHTHEMNPPVDACGLGDCTVAHLGTLMSYCDTCPGGVANIRMEFHPRVISERIMPFLSSLPCALPGAGAQITSHPSGQNVTAGAQAQFQVQATGGGVLTYRWRREGVDLVNSARISGAGTAALTISSAQMSDAGMYDVVVENACGMVVSQPAILSVGQVCYANCDQSTVPPILNVNDFTCFINQFVAGMSLPHAQQTGHYANCDQSTWPPVLNVNDFTCFLNAFAAGCP